MTKYEWESELKKNIHRLPEDEVRKVFEYYTELFEDKIERGADERNIIMEFGNPVDVADKILAEYYSLNPGTTTSVKPTEDYTSRSKAKRDDNENFDYGSQGSTNKVKDYNSVDAENARRVEAMLAPKQNTEAWRKVLYICLCVVLGSAVLGMAFLLWTVVIATFISGAVCVVAGLVCIVPSIMMWSSGMYQAIVQLGVCLLLVGLGLLMMFIGRRAIGLSTKLTKKSFGAFKKVLGDKRSKL